MYIYIYVFVYIYIYIRYEDQWGIHICRRPYKQVV